MKVRWLGNAALEVFSDKHIWIDPNLTVEPEREPDIILLTHEHDDHFSPEDYAGLEGKVKLYGPETTLEKFDLEGTSVEPGDEIDGIKVLDCDCYASDESVTYLHNGLLHAGDSAYFPEAESVELIFTACFPDYYDDYISAFKRLEPEMVIPFHYDPEDGLDDAEGLKKRMDEEGIPNRILEPGDSVKV
ncbi:MAG: MBL fold metallo-hydrolase [Candidatus Thermoplasmatota archaeon]|nr:MBL fold metallo-hydrolase [Candidatus Thermoplasmatota archaeon]